MKKFDDLDRTASLKRMVPDLFEANPLDNARRKLLYIGARDDRTDYIDDFIKAHYDITLVEIFEPNAINLRKVYPSLYVTQGDVRIYQPMGPVDIVFWWHGPEHVYESEIAPALKLIESYTKETIILGCPYGYFRQGNFPDNPNEAHATDVLPEMFEGYDIELLGNKDQRGSNITAVKRL